MERSRKTAVSARLSRPRSFPDRIPAALAAAALLVAAGAALQDAAERTLDATVAPEARLAGELDLLFTEVAGRVKRAVVSVDAASPAEGPSLAAGSPADGQPGAGGRERSGSGFLIDPRGYVLTNHHLVAGGAEVMVRLHDGAERRARLVQADQASDIALLKVEHVDELPALELGDSEALRVGQWVIAVGSPFGLTQTVSTGIISALERTDLRVIPFESFIQTDASINPGNSGGPLIDLAGRVVGINTAIFSSRGGGSQGLGFAVPISLAKALVERWIAGKTTSHLGLTTSAVSRDMARYFGLDDLRGAFVARAEAGGPAALAGIEPKDVILRFGDVEVRDDVHLRVLAAETPPGSKVAIEVLRRGERRIFEVVLGERAWPAAGDAAPAAGDPGPSARLLGLTVLPLAREEARAQSLPETTRGMLVADVQPGSPSSHKGLRRADVLTEVDDLAVATVADVKRALAAAGDVVMLRVHRAGEDLGYIFVPR
jgi:serine protease Do